MCLWKSELDTFSDSTFPPASTPANRNSENRALKTRILPYPDCILEIHEDSPVKAKIDHRVHTVRTVEHSSALSLPLPHYSLEAQFPEASEVRRSGQKR